RRRHGAIDEQARGVHGGAPPSAGSVPAALSRRRPVRLSAGGVLLACWALPLALATATFAPSRSLSAPSTTTLLPGLSPEVPATWSAPLWPIPTGCTATVSSGLTT